MTPELKVAVERLRNKRDSYYLDDCPPAGNDLYAYVDDLKLASDAYLAEHPEDDDEPVTEEWLLERGFKHTTIDGLAIAGRFDRWYEKKSLRQQCLVVSVEDGHCFLLIVSGEFGPQLSWSLGIATRRKVRLLLEVLSDA